MAVKTISNRQSVRTTQPLASQMIRPNFGDRFGRRLVTFLYAYNLGLVADAVTGNSYRCDSGSFTIEHNAIGMAVNGGFGPKSIRSGVCPAGALCNAPQTIFYVLRGCGPSWQTDKGLRFRDNSSGSNWEFRVGYINTTTMFVRMLSFGDTGKPEVSITGVNPFAPHVMVTTGDGAGVWRMFIDGKFAATQTITPDANQSGTDTLLWAMSSSSLVFYNAAGVLTGLMSDTEVAEFSTNVWRCLAPPMGIPTFKPDSVTGTLKTANGLARAQIKTIQGLPIASVKTYNGLTP